MESKKDEIIVLPQQENLSLVAEFLEKRMELMELSVKLANKVQVSADEIFSNIVNYSGASETRVFLKKSDNSIELKFEDNGKPFDPTEWKKPDISLAAEEREIGGLGIFMVSKMTSSMKYECRNGWNILTLIFAGE